MSLKELTREKHAEAENTAFMQAIFKKQLPLHLWVDYTQQRQLFYHGIEGIAGAAGLLHDLPDIRRAFYLYLDYREMAGDQFYYHRPEAVDYYNYIISLFGHKEKILAHLYVWHMGDLFGGQMIKKIVPGSHKSLEFQNPQLIMTNLRAKLDDTLAEEAIVAFEWAIKILKSYDNELNI